jgi:hypothetical protein
VRVSQVIALAVALVSVLLLARKSQISPNSPSPVKIVGEG